MRSGRSVNILKDHTRTLMQTGLGTGGYVCWISQPAQSWLTRLVVFPQTGVRVTQKVPGSETDKASTPHSAVNNCAMRSTSQRPFIATVSTSLRGDIVHFPSDLYPVSLSPLSLRTPTSTEGVITPQSNLLSWLPSRAYPLLKTLRHQSLDQSPIVFDIH